MGYGLVAVPRLLWRSADVQGQQRMLYAQAGQQAEAALHARRCERVTALQSMHTTPLASGSISHACKGCTALYVPAVCAP